MWLCFCYSSNFHTDATMVCSSLGGYIFSLLSSTMSFSYKGSTRESVGVFSDDTISCTTWNTYRNCWISEGTWISMLSSARWAISACFSSSKNLLMAWQIDGWDDAQTLKLWTYQMKLRNSINHQESWWPTGINISKQYDHPEQPSITPTVISFPSIMMFLKSSDHCPETLQAATNLCALPTTSLLKASQYSISSWSAWVASNKGLVVEMLWSKMLDSVRYLRPFLTAMLMTWGEHLSHNH